MATGILESLRNKLDDGLSIVTRVWEYKTKSWVTSICAADIDADGDIEIIACSREGRIYLLSKTGNLRWKRIVGPKVWIGAATVFSCMIEGKKVTRIVIGTRGGKIYMLDKDGRTITRDGRALIFDEDGRTLDQEGEKHAYWYDTGYVIRQIYVDPQHPDEIIIGSEDRCAHGIDATTGELLWKFRTEARVRTVFSYDMDGDGVCEILVGSTDRVIYMLDRKGQLIGQHRVEFPVRALTAVDVDNDGAPEILVTTDGKDLIALNWQPTNQDGPGYFKEKWRRQLACRLLTFCVVDIDRDGSNEIIAGSDDKHVYIFDEQAHLLWRHNHKYNIYSVCPCDIDGDGRAELLLGTEQERVRAMRIRLRRGVERQVRRYYKQMGSPDPNTLVELASDELSLLRNILHMDGREIVTLREAQEQIRQGSYEQALVTLLKLEEQKVERLWHKDTIGHTRTLCLRRTANEARREIVLVTFDGHVSIFHPGGRLVWSGDLHDRIIDMQTGFLDHSRQENIICLSNKYMYILDENQRRVQMNEAFMSSICVISPSRHSPPEIIVGSEDHKLSIYQGDLQSSPSAVLPTREGVRFVRAQLPIEENMPEFVVASLGYVVSAYTRNGKYLWSYETRDRVRAIEIRDINGDGRPEILIGSEDRNLHVLDSQGYLLWRYYLAQTVLSIDVIDINQDHKIEILVGCDDGTLCVFTREGDLLWTYQARDRINALRVEDIDGDGNLEIATGAEDDFELLRVVDMLQVNNLIAQCWSAWCQQHPGLAEIRRLLERVEVHPLLRVFALHKLVEQSAQIPTDLDIETMVALGPLEIRKTFATLIPMLYPRDPARIDALLAQLSADVAPEVRNAVVDHLPALMSYAWEAGVGYLESMSQSSDRFLKRLVVRKLCQLIDTSAERPVGRRREIFHLLLSDAQYKDSEWVRQEAARALARFLDQHYGNLIVYTHLFIVKEIEPSILKQIRQAATNMIVKKYIQATCQLLTDLNEDNVCERLQQMIQVQLLATDLIYGEDLCRLYVELSRLFTFLNIDEIANYECLLKINTFDPKNRYAHVVLAVFEQLSLMVSRPLKIYLQRESIYDRLASLLDSLDAIEQVRAYIERQYTYVLLDEPLTKLPDRQIFLFVLTKWQNLIRHQLNELRGNAEIKVELQTRDVAREEQVSIWLAIKNSGRSSATSLEVALLYSDFFEIVGDHSFETEVLPPGEETIAEFTLRPHQQQLILKFEITYVDVNRSVRVEEHEDYLIQREHTREFRLIPNPYSTGVPMHDQRMFYGREEDMTILEDNLTRNAESVIVLYGQRRSGKTTLLVQLVHSAALEPHIPVIIDMQRTSYHITVESFLYHVASYIARTMRQKHLLIALPGIKDFKDDPTHIFDSFLDQVEEQLTGRKLLLLVDEFEALEEQVSKGNLQPEIFAYLRNIVQHRRFISFLFAGTHKITEYTKWYRSVFFNIAFHHRLSRLNAAGAEDLIQRPVEGFLKYEEVTVRKIRQLTADQPYLIHLMCRAIIDYCNHQGKTYVTINDVNIVLDKVMETGEFHLDWLWDQVKPEERVALATLAEGGREEGRWLAFSELEEIYTRYWIRYKPEYLMEALKTLIDADIVESEPGNSRKNTLDTHRFKIPVGLTRKWLLREHPLEIVRKEMNG